MSEFEGDVKWIAPGEPLPVPLLPRKLFEIKFPIYGVPARYSVSVNKHGWSVTKELGDQPELTLDKPFTNFERFKAMTVDEMADALLDWFAAFYAVEWSKEEIINWLQQEAECTKD